MQQQRQKQHYEKKQYSRPRFDWSGTLFKPNPKPSTFEEMMEDFLKSSNIKQSSVQRFVGQRDEKKSVKCARRQAVANSRNNSLGG
jgi:hypothetical protein